MERRNFIKSCGYACIGGTALAVLFQSCKTTKNLTAIISESDILLEINEFEIIKKGKTSYHGHIILDNDILKHPICVFRINETNYSAVYLECSHQGAELQVFGDKLHCPAHGAEFNNTGKVNNGPAEIQLRTFPITIDNNKLKISLK